MHSVFLPHSSNSVEFSQVPKSCFQTFSSSLTANISERHYDGNLSITCSSMRDFLYPSHACFSSAWATHDNRSFFCLINPLSFALQAGGCYCWFWSCDRSQFRDPVRACQFRPDLLQHESPSEVRNGNFAARLLAINFSLPFLPEPSNSSRRLSKSIQLTSERSYAERRRIHNYMT